MKTMNMETKPIPSLWEWGRNSGLQPVETWTNISLSEEWAKEPSYDQWKLGLILSSEENEKETQAETSGNRV